MLGQLFFEHDHILYPMVIPTIRLIEKTFFVIGHIYSEDIEALADTAVEAHVFAFLSETVIKSCLFQQEVNFRNEIFEEKNFVF